MKNINSPTGGRFLSLAEPCDDKAMDWQNNNTKRQVDEAKEEKNNHLSDESDSATDTANDTRLSIENM